MLDLTLIALVVKEIIVASELGEEVESTEHTAFTRLALSTKIKKKCLVGAMAMLSERT